MGTAEDGGQWWRWLVCGAGAGLAVDLSLFPLDTLKTRLQSHDGFRASGGFRNLGMSSVAIGSAPGAAIFFLTYRYINHIVATDSASSHAAAASLAEVAACAVRVPTELIKQRAQAAPSFRISALVKQVFTTNGLRGFYRGYATTVAREIPFSLVELPLWEALKKAVANRKGRACSPFEAATCGSVAGAVAAAVTTPLDVAKTRVMLSTGQVAPTFASAIQGVWRTGGMRGLFAGVTPRTLWMALGGFVFFGAYEGLHALSLLAFPPLP